MPRVIIEWVTTGTNGAKAADELAADWITHNATILLDNRQPSVSIDLEHIPTHDKSWAGITEGASPTFSAWVRHIATFAGSRGDSYFTTSEVLVTTPDGIYSGSNRHGRTRSALRRLVNLGYLNESPGKPISYRWTGKPWPFLTAAQAPEDI